MSEVRCRRRRLRTAGRVLTVPLLVLVTALVAAPAGADTRMEVATTADDYFQPGTPIPLLVTISADGAVSGTLTASFDGVFGGSLAVEVPGGSTKEFLFVATGPPWSSTVQLAFDATDNDANASARLTLRSPGVDEVVGLLPALIAGRDVPATADLNVDVGQARLFTVDPALLAQSPEVLNPFTQLVATADDLDALDQNQLRAIETWVATRGGTLVIDEAPATPVPLALQATPGDTTRAEIGLGRVRFSGGLASDGNFDGLLSPTISRATDEFPFGGGQFGSVPTTLQLSRDANVRIPAIGSLLGLLVLYSVVAGPVLWLVLRRSQREPLLWVALPALAVATTVGVYGFGQSLRSGTSTAHATLVADLPASRLVSSQVLVTSPNGGRAGVTLTDGWRPVSTVSEDFGDPWGGPGRSTSRQFSDGDNLITDLPAGGIGLVTAELLLPEAQTSWEFDLSPDGDSLQGTITNRTSHTLENILVTSGQGVARVASLAPGTSADITMDNVNQPILTTDRFMERLMTDDAWSPNDGPTNPGILVNWLARHPGLRAPGVVLAVGWTRDAASPLATTEGQPVTEGRTAFLGTQQVEVTDIDAAANPVEVLRGWSTSVADQPVGGACTDVPLVLRYPSGRTAAPDDAVLAVPGRYVSALDLWDGETWVPAGLAQVAGQDVTVAVPDNAFVSNEVYVRILMSCDFWGAAAPLPELRAIQPGDEPLDPIGDGADV